MARECKDTIVGLIWIAGVIDAEIMKATRSVLLAV